MIADKDRQEGSTGEEIRALLVLLDDPDEDVQRAVRKRLTQADAEFMGDLRAAARAVHPAVEERLDLILGALGRPVLEARWSENLRRPAPDLEAGALLLAGVRQPDLNWSRCRTRLDQLAADARPEVERHQGADKALALGRHLCRVEGFRGNHADYFSPDNSFLNRVLDQKTGIPITLSLVLILVGRRLGLPLSGVNMPVHFLARCEHASGPILIDMYRGAAPVERRDAVRFLVRAGIVPRPEHFEPCPDRTLLLRMVRNLVAIGLRDETHADLRELERWLRPE